MFVYPDINPVAIQFGVLKIYWYGLMYVFAFLGCWWLTVQRAKKLGDIWTYEDISDLLFYVALGVILGGRIGYLLFYDLANVISDPLSAFKIWEGGMSFHGGFLGVLLGFWYFGYKSNFGFIYIADFVAPVIPLGLSAGRLGNFINGELWGRYTDVPWAMVFAHVDKLPRHPSQIYEFLLEGILLFIILWKYSSKPRPPFAVSALFLLGYGIFRFFVEFFRQPDLQYGYVAFGWLTMGQLLSFPMIIIGIIGLFYAYRENVGENQ